MFSVESAVFSTMIRRLVVLGMCAAFSLTSCYYGASAHIDSDIRGGMRGLEAMLLHPCQVDTLDLMLWYEYSSDFNYWRGHFFKPPYLIPADSLPTASSYRKAVFYYPMMRMAIREEAIELIDSCGLAKGDYFAPEPSARADSIYSLLDTLTTTEYALTVSPMRNGRVVRTLNLVYKLIKVRAVVQYLGEGKLNLSRITADHIHPYHGEIEYYVGTVPVFLVRDLLEVAAVADWSEAAAEVNIDRPR